ncbi:RluA family pseudouridine synthase [Aquabacterium sp. OR-4]|uniref:RluA family pseudouridine synthase n=1 Tax=Aquabacterium sp. OR-4 TaxID=2978127 RepID=UPI0021B21999|nr:RluA family pseudouridine synthase [Aquabacterium sp. OR-4]MDT7835486.1 RluA family pseudouridine synthase [Aquabacterium sp. OR-4]
MADPADAIDAADAAEAADSPDEAQVEWREAAVARDQHGLRLDKALVALAPEFSRSHLQGLIDRGHVQLDGQVQATASRKLRAGQHLRVELVPTAESQAFRPEPMALSIVYEDAHMLVINKPAGLVVHPAAGHWSGTLLNGLLAHHAGAAVLPRAGIVHRLDKDTSGLMVVAKTLPAMTALVRRIAARDVHRVYLALAHGAVPWARSRIDAPVGRDPASRLRMAVVASGKAARTDVERLAVVEIDGRAVTAVRCKLHTGRTHQIRVHLSSRGHPLLADALYGGRPVLGLQRQALHAAELAFAHPADERPMAFAAALPPDLAAAWAQVQPGAPAVAQD